MKSESWKITSALRIRMAHLEEEEVDENTDIFVFRPKMEIARYPPPVAQMTALQALWRDDWDPEFSQIHAEIKEDRGIPDDA